MKTDVRKTARLWIGRTQRAAGRQRSVRLALDELEARNAPGSLFGDPLSSGPFLGFFPTSDQPAAVQTSGWETQSGDPAPRPMQPKATPSSPLETHSSSAGSRSAAERTKTSDYSRYDPVWEQTYLLRHVYMDGTPLPELSEPVYNDERAYTLLGQILATPDVLAEGAGSHVYTHVPPIGSYYNGSGPDGKNWNDRPVPITYTVSGAEFGIVAYGSNTWTVSYTNQFQAFGLAGNILTVFMRQGTRVTRVAVYRLKQ